MPTQDDTGNPERLVTKEELERFVYLSFIGDPDRESPLSSSIFNELVESAGTDQPAEEYISPIDALIRDLEELKDALLTGKEPLGF